MKWKILFASPVSTSKNFWRIERNEENIDFEMATVVNSCCICLCEKSVHESSYWYKCVPVVNSRILLNIFNRLRSASV